MYVKICGLRRLEDIEYANKLKPDYIGFIFAEKSKRRIDFNEALKLKEKLDKDIKAVGVFLNQDIEYVIEASRLHIIDLIQLHGDESDSYIKELKERTNLEIINVYRESIYADYVMYDNKDAGSGIYQELSYKKGQKPIFLAGGISISNLDEIKKQKPFCVDVSSSVETDGFKDYKKMEEFIRRVRQ